MPPKKETINKKDIDEIKAQIEELGKERDILLGAIKGNQQALRAIWEAQNALNENFKELVRRENRK